MRSRMFDVLSVDVFEVAFCVVGEEGDFGECVVGADGGASEDGVVRERAQGCGDFDTLGGQV